MKYGFVKTAAISPKIKLGDCVYNAQSILHAISEAYGEGASLIVLPELCITGASCGDLMKNRRLCDSALSALLYIVKETKQLSCVTVCSLPMYFYGEICTCAAVFSAGKILGIVPKNAKTATLNIGGTTVPCGELSFRCASLPELCFCIEMGESKPSNAPLVLHLDSLPETAFSESERRALFCARSKTEHIGIVCCGAGEGESTTDGVCAGHKMIIEDGALVAQSRPFEGEMLISELDAEYLAARHRFGENTEILFDLPQTKTRLTRKIEKCPFLPSYKNPREVCDRVIEIQSRALAQRLSHVGAKKAVLGISGGLDSTLALLVSVRAMQILKRPSSDVLAITMPCFGTTERTKSNAERMCELLGTELLCIDISESVTKHLEDIAHPLDLYDTAFENAQARERTQVLMDYANQAGGFVVGTGDLSELALGFATYNGDHMSMYAVNASVPKTLMRKIIENEAQKCENAELAVILRDVVATPVSPELLPVKDNEQKQKTEDIIGPYELHDFFIWQIVRNNFTPEKTCYLAKYAFSDTFDERIIAHWLSVFCKRFVQSQFKRSCLPDGPDATGVSLSPRKGFSMPSDACAEILSFDNTKN